MRMIPPTLLGDNGSSAERRVFRKLENTTLDKNACAMHSVTLPEHVYKRMGEIDFVVVSDAGVLVCEVKGGRVRRGEDGYWHFKNRFDEVSSRKEGPFRQAESAMWSLRNDLEGRIPKEQFREISFGYCVIFTDVAYEDDSVDSPKGLVIDGDEFAFGSDLGAPLQRLLSRWQGKNGVGRMSPQAMHDVRSALRPSFDLVPSLRLRVGESNVRMESLTAAQYEALDWVESHDRLLFSGGAGTGKTLLGVEIARREGEEGARVLVTCKSETLAAFLRSRAPAGVHVAAFDAARRMVTEHGAFDVVVVDEAQDVFTGAGFDILDELCGGGLESGRWRCLYDVNNQAGLFGPVEEDAVEMLRSTGAHEVPLRRNCRNTKAIVLQTQMLTAADLGHPIAGEGQKVSFVSPEDRVQEAQAIAAEIERLTNDGVGAGAITILTAGPISESPVALLPADLWARVSVLDAQVAAAWPSSSVTVSTIEGFKGFENDFVLVCGLSALDETKADHARLYVAMSRARYGLWMAIPSALKRQFNDLRTRNLESVLAAQKEASA